MAYYNCNLISLLCNNLKIEQLFKSANNIRFNQYMQFQRSKHTTNKQTTLLSARRLSSVRFQLFPDDLYQKSIKQSNNQKVHMASTQRSSNVQSRGTVQIIYSSISGTSKNAAAKVQQLLEQNNYTAPVINIGDFNTDDYLGYRGIIIFLLSTYGDASSPVDGQHFLEWLQTLENKQLFGSLQYCILAFGNSYYVNHCGFGLKTEKVLNIGGAKELIELTMCDSDSKQNNFFAKFPKWSQKLIKVLDSKDNIQNQPRSISQDMNYQVTLQKRQNFDWEQQAMKCKNLSKEFSNYLNMHKCKVIHIKQIRKKNNDGRSTMWVRIQTNKDVHFVPGCNVIVFPLNPKLNQTDDDLIISFSEIRNKIPFPPMPLGELKRLLYFNQNATHRQIKKAIELTTEEGEIVGSYEKLLEDREDNYVTCRKLVQDLKPNMQFLAQIGLNRVRTSTLASWDPAGKYIDLCVSLVQNGLFSEHLKTHPQYIRVKGVVSSFFIPQKKPIVMIANGSGMAPFRSLIQYCDSLPEEQRVSMRLYYGIQSRDIDLYFEQNWRDLEKRGIIELFLAESRREGAKKEYVQDILEKDIDWLTDHIFNKQGRVFICGGLQMAKATNKVIIRSLMKQTKSKEQAMTLLATMKQQKIIVEQVYG